MRHLFQYFSTFVKAVKIVSFLFFILRSGSYNIKIIIIIIIKINVMVVIGIIDYSTTSLNNII